MKKPDTDNGLKIITKIADLKKRCKRCLSPDKTAAIYASLQPLLNAAWHAQQTDTEPPVYTIRVATALIALAESDIKQAEQAIKKKHDSQNQTHRSPAQTETDHTTHSDNLPLASSQEEDRILQEFESVYANIPHPQTKEPIDYIDETQEHEELALNRIHAHYHDLKETLTCLLYTSPSPRD